MSVVLRPIAIQGYLTCKKLDYYQLSNIGGTISEGKFNNRNIYLTPSLQKSIKQFIMSSSPNQSSIFNQKEQTKGQNQGFVCKLKPSLQAQALIDIGDHNQQQTKMEEISSLRRYLNSNAYPYKNSGFKGKQTQSQHPQGMLCTFLIYMLEQPSQQRQDSNASQKASYVNILQSKQRESLENLREIQKCFKNRNIQYSKQIFEQLLFTANRADQLLKKYSHN